MKKINLNPDFLHTFNSVEKNLKKNLIDSANKVKKNVWVLCEKII